MRPFFAPGGGWGRFCAQAGAAALPRSPC